MNILGIILFNIGYILLMFVYIYREKECSVRLSVIVCYILLILWVFLSLDYKEVFVMPLWYGLFIMINLYRLINEWKQIDAVKLRNYICKEKDSVNNLNFKQIIYYKIKYIIDYELKYVKCDFINIYDNNLNDIKYRIYNKRYKNGEYMYDNEDDETFKNKNNIRINRFNTKKNNKKYDNIFNRSTSNNNLGKYLDDNLDNDLDIDSNNNAINDEVEIRITPE